ncbi:peroxisomal acyl-coenzyme A oxidase 1-like [Mya arenaria]|uniref:peroxisomal acyl-coenzyme A oxidase 1-like n=1 Tax=Mya arenaria TaxID=6604 RepID=UPI0022E4C63C|nr:peroxisomal acyl-coenzyme A oxidase 1-like [Mya arenaria]
MASVKINPDLAKERKSASFDCEALTEVVYGGKENVRRKRYLQNIVFQDKSMQSFPPWWNRDRETLYDVGIKKSIYMIKLIKQLNIKDLSDIFYIRGALVSHENFPLGIHESMFMPTIEKQGTPEQIEKYLTPARQFKIIGTYAQTEVGHGTFIRGLETMATYDPATEEFIINSPTITAMKYWPAGLGRTCNYAVVMAQLNTQGKNMGIHAFVVQIRSLHDHKPMPGVQLGDIGNKLGFNGMDNGYLIFNNYRVPRDAMLMRYAKVEKDGTYVAPKNAKLAYGAMVYIRAMIVGSMGISCAMAATIATRYSAVRRQTEIRPGGPEPQVIDYQTQQEKLFPMIAAAFAWQFTGNFMMAEYNRVSADIEKGNMEEYQSLHALAAGLKALSSDIANEGIDKLRRACGGHGYTHASGLPKIWTHITPACTYEGENTVMYLQCARYLVKVYAQVSKGQQLPGFMSYLNKPQKPKSSINEAIKMEDLTDLYEHASVRMIQVAATRLLSLLKSGNSMEDARNLCGVQMVEAARMHSYLYTVRTFQSVIQARASDPKVAKVLTSLCQLFAVNGILQRLGDFLQDGFLSGQQAAMLADRQLALFADIRPNAVALVDSFDYRDEVLESCLGRYDGNVYEALYEYAKDSPLNKQEVSPSYYTTLKPLMEGKLTFDTPTARL